MIRALIAVVLTLGASAARAEFNPPDGQAWRYVTTQTRSDGATERRFTVERKIVFTRVEGGFVADLTLLAIDDRGAGPAGGIFERALGALAGKPVRFRLDPNGNVLSVDDQDAVWARIVDGLAGAGGKPSSGRGTAAEQVASPLRQLPVARQRSMLASMLTPVIAGAAADTPIGLRQIGVPLRAYLSRGASLPGTERVSRQDGVVRIETQAEGDIAPDIPVGTPGTDIAPPTATMTSHIRVATLRHIDTSTGLVTDSSDDSRTSIGKATLSVTTRTVLTPMVL